MSNVREKRDIEWLVNWALEKQCVWSETASGSGLNEPSASTPLARMMAMGTVVQGGSGSFGLRWAHRDAMIIADEISAMGRNDGIVDLVALVVKHGLRGNRPDWGQDGIGRHELVRNGKGKVQRRYADQHYQRGLMGFEFEFIGLTYEEVEMMMVEYAGWWETLAVLRGRLVGKLSKFEATGPVASQWPWDQYAESVIHYPDGTKERVM